MLRKTGGGQLMSRAIAAILLCLVFALSFAQSDQPSPSPVKGGQDKQGLSNQGKNESANDLRGTDNKPVVIKILPYPKTQQDEANDAKDREQKAANERLTVVSNWLLVIFNGVLAVCTIALYRVTRKTANAADLNARAVIGLELPILRAKLAELTHLSEPMPEKGSYSGSSDNGPPGNHSAIGYIEFINYGRTPAFPVRFEGGWVVEENLPKTPVYFHSREISHATVIRPGEDYVIDTGCGINLTDLDVVACANETAWLWFYGKLSYVDFMGAARDAKFCWRYSNFNRDFGSVSFGFASDGNPPAQYIR
jgi:hypothetical protein